MMQRAYIIILIFCIYGLAATQSIGQRTNPFDIINTKNALTTEAPIITKSQNSNNLDSSSLDSSSPTVSSAPQSVNQFPGTDTLSSDTLIPFPTLAINDSNPFNIKKTNSTVLKNPERKAIVSDDIGNNTIQDLRSKSDPNASWLSELKPKKSGSSTINYSLNFIFWIILASILILAAVINLKRKSFLNLYKAITNDNYLKLLQREENNGSSFFFLLLYFLFFLNAALFIYQVLINKFELNGYKLFLFLFAALIIIYLARLIATFILGATFPLEKETKQYSFTIIMFNIIVGLLLIPVNILTAYAPFGSNMTYVGLGIIILFYVLRQIRGLFIAARIKGLRYFHFFIYLCTFEVAPFFWIISFVKNW